MSRKPSKPETRIEDYLDVMTGGNAALPQPILRIEFYYAFLAGMAVELPQPILDDEKLLAKICGMDVEAPTYIPGLSPRLYAYMAKKGGQDVQVPDPILRLECYWYDYSTGEAPSVQEYTGAVPVTFVADGTPLLDYIISGNTVQNGTPTPDNPIMPQGTGERTGNLYPLDESKLHVGRIENDGTIDYEIGTLTVGTNSVTYEVNAAWRGFYTDFIQVNENEKLTFSPNNSSTIAWSCSCYDENDNFLGKATGQSTNYIKRFTLLTGTKKVRMSVTSSDTTYTILRPMLNTGSAAKPYEPYGYKIPISSAGQTNNIYLGEVQTTRKIRKWVLTGNESWNRAGSSHGYFTSLPSPAKLVGVNGIISSHYQSSMSSADGTIRVAQGSVETLIYDNYTSVADFKAFLAAQYAAGTPVTIWYVLSNEETGIVNEPLMKIGDYSDTLSHAQAGVSIPTANGSTTLDVETTVKPSEIYIKYRGEAVATLSTLSAEVSSPEETPEEVNPEEMEEEENER